MCDLVDRFKDYLNVGVCVYLHEREIEMGKVEERSRLD